MVLVRFVLIILILRITSDTNIILTLDIKIRKLNSSMLNQNVRMLVEKHKRCLKYIRTSAISKIQRNDHRIVKPISSVIEV